MQKRRKLRIAAIVLVGALILTAVVQIPRAIPPAQLKDLNFEAHSWHGYTVYIEESGAYQPYYVLTDRYNGQEGAALLLRKDVPTDLREYEPYTREGSYSSYYENSSIDRFLNDFFFTTLSPSVQKSVLDSTITITSKSSIGAPEHYVLDITRKVFLPSITELGFDNDNLMETEGVPLKCFRGHPKKILIAKRPSGVETAWWTRTASKWGTTTAWSIGFNGWSSSEQTGALYGVRPAFCLSGDLPVKTAEVAPGTQGYVIA